MIMWVNSIRLIKLIFLLNSSVFLLISNTTAQNNFEQIYRQSIDLVLEGRLNEAKIGFNELLEIIPNETGVLHFLGLIQDQQENLDSAIFYYNKSIENNVEKTTLMYTQLRLVKAYLRKINFDSAYQTALGAIEMFPGNPLVIKAFNDVCSWSYSIKYHQLDSNYLRSNSLEMEYKVFNASDEFLILANIRNQRDASLILLEQYSDDEFDYLICKYHNDSILLKVKFITPWNRYNVDDYIKKNIGQAIEVLNKSHDKSYVKLGGLIVASKSSKEVLNQQTLSDDFAFRYCACSQLNNNSSQELIDRCTSDENQHIRKLMAALKLQ